MVYSQWAWYTHSGRGILTVGVVYSQWAWYTHSGRGGLTVGVVYTQWAWWTHSGHGIHTKLLTAYLHCRAKLIDR